VLVVVQLSLNPEGLVAAVQTVLVLQEHFLKELMEEMAHLRGHYMPVVVAGVLELLGQIMLTPPLVVMVVTELHLQLLGLLLLGQVAVVASVLMKAEALLLVDKVVLVEVVTAAEMTAMITPEFCLKMGWLTLGAAAAVLVTEA